MDEQSNNEEIDASQALQKARKQARAQAKDHNKQEKSAKKGGAILHVNNYRNGIPEARCKMSKNPNFPATLKTNYIVRSKGASSSENTFVVEAKLAPRIYMVRNQKTDKFCSLKIEPYYNEGDVKQLRRDVFILMEAAKQDSRFNHHFPKLISKGRVGDNFNYMVSTLCDFNLDDLREKVLKSDFTQATAARLSMQAFQAVHDLHTLGYLHRNIAPSKFMLGLENSTLIYLGGFSTAYHFKRKDGKTSPSPKKLYKMTKTRFLPRVYHRFKEFSRFDDLESWLFTSIDFFGRKLLPWFDNMDESQIIANKERFFFDAFEEIFTYAPKQLQVIQRYLDKNNDDDKPNYTFMGITLVGMRDRIKFPYTGPFDFQQSHVTSAKRSGKHKKATKEQHFQEDGGGGGEDGAPAIAPTSTALKKKKKAPRSSLAPVSNQHGGDDGELFEEGEAEVPQEDGGGGKPALVADRALSMARKKKVTRDAAVKAAQAELDNGDDGPLQPLEPDVEKNMKKKKVVVARAPCEEEDDEAGSEMQHPPVYMKNKKKSKNAAKEAKKKPAETPPENNGGGEEDGEEKEGGNDL